MDQQQPNLQQIQPCVVIPMEAAGTAIATAASQLASFAAAFAFMYKYRETFDFQLKLSCFKIDKL
ncbi:MAG: hypothetical protein HDT33_07785 [Clostridiales bacterium]|nr:hypothetical protein [Clostridiales bacterium]